MNTFGQTVPPPRPEDSTITKAELEQKRARLENGGLIESPSKKMKTQDAAVKQEAGRMERRKGIAPIKQEYVQ